VHDDELLGAFNVDREGSSAIALESRVDRFDGCFDIVRIVIATLNDDQVFQAACDEQLPLVEEAGVTGAHEGAVTRVGQAGVKRVGRFVRTVPVSLRDAGTADPDFADLIVGTGEARLRVDNSDLLIGDRLAAAH
jgi:hypothetical protein